MQQTNQQIVEAIYDAAKRGDLPTIMSYIDPEIEAIEADSLPYGGTFHGLEGFQKLFSLVFASWRSFEFEVDSVLDGGAYVVALMRVKIGLKGSDTVVDTRVAEFWKLRDGKVIELRPFYWDTAALLGHGRS